MIPQIVKAPQIAPQMIPRVNNFNTMNPQINNFNPMVPQIVPQMNNFYPMGLQMNPPMNNFNPNYNQMNPLMYQVPNQGFNQFYNQGLNRLMNPLTNQTMNQLPNQVLNQQLNQMNNQQTSKENEKQENKENEQQDNKENEKQESKENEKQDNKENEQQENEDNEQHDIKNNGQQNIKENKQTKNDEKNQDHPTEEDIFNEKRKIGENDDPVCEIIRGDKIEEFIIFVNKNCFPLKSIIKPSIFETNSFLLKLQEIKHDIFEIRYNLGDDHPTLIEYAAFFGSIQIFKYLYKNNVEFTSSLWLYAIHGQNPEIFSILEENGINPSDDSYKKCFKESLKCHHNEIANYIIDNYLLNGEENSMKTLSKCLKYHNFAYIPKNLKSNVFTDLCKYDYYPLVEIMLKTKNIDINHRVIFFFLIFLNAVLLLII